MTGHMALEMSLQRVTQLQKLNMGWERHVSVDHRVVDQVQSDKFLDNSMLW